MIMNMIVTIVIVHELPFMFTSRKNIHVELWSAVLGLHSQGDQSSPEVQRRGVDQVIISNQYNRLTKQADIAMMHLETPVNLTSTSPVEPNS